MPVKLRPNYGQIKCKKDFTGKHIFFTPTKTEQVSLDNI